MISQNPYVQLMTYLVLLGQVMMIPIVFGRDVRKINQGQGKMLKTRSVHISANLSFQFHILCRNDGSQCLHLDVGKFKLAVKRLVNSLSRNMLLINFIFSMVALDPKMTLLPLVVVPFILIRSKCKISEMYEVSTTVHLFCTQYSLVAIAVMPTVRKCFESPQI